MRVFCVSLIVLSLAFSVGCGGSPQPAKVTPPPQPSANELKSRLENFVQTGIAGSAVVGMKEAIEKLPAEKSEPLLQDFNKLTATNEPNEVKAIAKRMLEKL